MCAWERLRERERKREIKRERISEGEGAYTELVFVCAQIVFVQPVSDSEFPVRIFIAVVVFHQIWHLHWHRGYALQGFVQYTHKWNSIYILWHHRHCLVILSVNFFWNIPSINTLKYVYWISSCCHTYFDFLNKLTLTYSTLVRMSIFYDDNLSHIHYSSQILISSVKSL